MSALVAVALSFVALLPANATVFVPAPMHADKSLVRWVVKKIVPRRCDEIRKGIRVTFAIFNLPPEILKEAPPQAKGLVGRTQFCGAKVLLNMVFAKDAGGNPKLYAEVEPLPK
ncbi:MAG TPA: hypothetical protein VHL34_14495 [Rhizomicrobium sp.]|nr:hypothetical protein [Rhizomicrobium sp.]